MEDWLVALQAPVARYSHPFYLYNKSRMQHFKFCDIYLKSDKATLLIELSNLGFSVGKWEKGVQGGLGGTMFYSDALLKVLRDHLKRVNLEGFPLEEGDLERFPVLPKIRTTPCDLANPPEANTNTHEF